MDTNERSGIYPDSFGIVPGTPGPETGNLAHYRGKYAGEYYVEGPHGNLWLTDPEELRAMGKALKNLPVRDGPADPRRPGAAERMAMSSTQNDTETIPPLTREQRQQIYEEEKRYTVRAREALPPVRGLPPLRMPKQRKRIGWRWFFNGHMLGALIGGLIGGWLIVQGLLQVQETWEKNKGPYILASEWMDGPDRVSKSEYKRVKYTQAGTLLFFGLVIWGFIAFAHEERKREAEKWERLEMPAVQRETKVETTIRHDPEDDSHIDLDQYDAHYHHILDTEFRTDEDFKRDLRAALERDKREPRNPDGSRRRPQLPPTPDELRYGPEAAKQRAEQAQPPPLPNGPRGQVQGGLE